MIYVPNAFINVDESDNNPTAALQRNAEKFKTEFAYCKMISQITNVKKFKIKFGFLYNDLYNDSIRIKIYDILGRFHEKETI